MSRRGGTKRFLSIGWEKREERKEQKVETFSIKDAEAVLLRDGRMAGGLGSHHGPYHTREMNQNMGEYGGGKGG